MTNYSRGANFERRCIRHLTKEGWDCARTAGSHGAADIWAARGGEFMFVQCQIDNYFEVGKVAAVTELAQRHGAQSWLAWRDNKKLIMKQVY